MVGVSVSRQTIILRGLRLRCPNCGHHPIFEGLRLQATCPLCFMQLQRGSGWWLGPLVINYGMVVFAWVLPLLLIWALGGLGLVWALVLIGVGGFVFPLLLYRFAWSLWLMAYYVVLPHELPENNTSYDNIDNT